MTNLADVLALTPVELETILRAARLPVDQRSRTMLYEGLSRIKREYALWEAARRQPDLGKAFGDIAEALNILLRVTFGNDVGRQAVSIMEKGTFLSPIELPFKLLTEYRETAVFYYQFYGYRPKMRRRLNEPDNLLFCRLYQLFGEIREERPGNTYLLYNFTMKCTNLLGIKVNLITPEAFRMRIKRMLDKQLKGFGSLAACVSDLPPAAFDQLSNDQRAMFGNMASIVRDMRLMAYWPAPKRSARCDVRNRPLLLLNKAPDTSTDL
jgi:hypothetical protein